MNARAWVLICSLTVIHFAIPATARAEDPNTLSPAELDAGWILLFDGQTDFGWKATSQANWKVADGVISVSEGSMGLLRTTSEFGDFELKVDFRNPAGTNSGVFLRTPAEPKDPATDCYELNIAAETVSPFPTGSFVKRKKALDTPVSDKWRSFHVKAEGGHFSVAVDGWQVLDYLDPKPLGRGYIGLQYNTGPVEFRNVKLKPLRLKSLFNGRDLSGWKTFAGKSSVISVTPEGALNIKNGPGQAESEALFGDFVFQGEIISNGKELNSGIFFRNIPGSLAQGYESQIQNGYKNGDRTQPKDCGTGGFYRRQNARKVVSNDFEWFHKTLVVSGPHMATWINGYQVSDWTDERKPSENPREGLRVAPGSLTIQGHDPTTNLSFRHLQAAELPAR